ncbi:hypothetical protein TNIN_282731 [Trichonephila inaurata madagascariensis]|uniref:Uncharacterized protein n=1 Tax=Trichonephila inaurata madagascariensis TaxID=2747483 RepID=A0A8X6X8T5_9ARAC|nr:hypothetical protein TNIN_282731 [Trichonephila inaurata madagascariensis]
MIASIATVYLGLVIKMKREEEEKWYKVMWIRYTHYKCSVTPAAPIRFLNSVFKIIDIKNRRSVIPKTKRRQMEYDMCHCCPAERIVFYPTFSFKGAKMLSQLDPIDPVVASFLSTPG